MVGEMVESTEIISTHNSLLIFQLWDDHPHSHESLSISHNMDDNIYDEMVDGRWDGWWDNDLNLSISQSTIINHHQPPDPLYPSSITYRLTSSRYLGWYSVWSWHEMVSCEMVNCETDEMVDDKIIHLISLSLISSLTISHLFSIISCCLNLLDHTRQNDKDDSSEGEWDMGRLYMR